MWEHELDILDPLSFFENYNAAGTAVMLQSTVKLLPKCESANGGQLFTSKVKLFVLIFCLAFDHSSLVNYIHSRY